MLSVNQSKIAQQKLILLARFSPTYVQNELIPEIERYSIQYGVKTQTIDEFQNNKSLEKCMYFHHSYAYADIPAGQEYDMIARLEKGKIQPSSVMECKTKVLHFFSAYRIQLMEYANHGHHENCLIQFINGIPDIIYELSEIADKKPLETEAKICLCSRETLQANISEFSLKDSLQTRGLFMSDLSIEAISSTKLPILE